MEGREKREGPSGEQEEPGFGLLFNERCWPRRGRLHAVRTSQPLGGRPASSSAPAASSGSNECYDLLPLLGWLLCAQPSQLHAAMYKYSLSSRIHRLVSPRLTIIRLSGVSGHNRGSSSISVYLIRLCDRYDVLGKNQDKIAIAECIFPIVLRKIIL